MPSNNEIKQIVTEKVFPFFEGNGLKDILLRLKDLEEKIKKIETPEKKKGLQ